MDINCGGALFIYGPGKMEITACVFENNSAHWGGAINCWGQAEPAITHCLFTGNTGGEDAGAIHCVAAAKPLIAENYFTKNSAKFGGAIHYLHASAPVIRNNYISGNIATRNSSAISCFGKSNPEIIANYIGENLVERDDKGSAIESVMHSTPTLKQNFIADNRTRKETGKGLSANAEFQGQKDESTCIEQEPASKEDVLKILKEKGVLELAPKETKNK
jgi:hypothetical protein